MPTVPVARLIVPASALVAGVARLPFLHWPLGAEAGYLLVGGQWRPSGTTLYGSCWVDRPPLLVTRFRFAADLAGAVPLRLTGCLATVVVVLAAPTSHAGVAWPTQGVMQHHGVQGLSDETRGTPYSLDRVGCVVPEPPG